SVMFLEWQNAPRTASGQNESFQLKQSPNVAAMRWRGWLGTPCLAPSPSCFAPSDNAPVPEGGSDLDVHKSRLRHESANLAPGVLLSIKVRQHHHVKGCDSKRPRAIVVKQHLMDDDPPARWETRKTLPSQKSTLLCWPVMENHTIEMEVRR